MRLIDQWEHELEVLRIAQTGNAVAADGRPCGMLANEYERLLRYQVGASQNDGARNPMVHIEKAIAIAASCGLNHDGAARRMERT